MAARKKITLTQTCDVCGKISERSREWNPAKEAAPSLTAGVSETDFRTLEVSDFVNDKNFAVMVCSPKCFGDAATNFATEAMKDADQSVKPAHSTVI